MIRCAPEPVTLMAGCSSPKTLASIAPPQRSAAVFCLVLRNDFAPFSARRQGVQGRLWVNQARIKQLMIHLMRLPSKSQFFCWNCSVHSQAAPERYNDESLPVFLLVIFFFLSSRSFFSQYKNSADMGYCEPVMMTRTVFPFFPVTSASIEMSAEISPSSLL